jgi:hypothetical protein
MKTSIAGTQFSLVTLIAGMQFKQIHVRPGLPLGSARLLDHKIQYFAMLHGMQMFLLHGILFPVTV